MIKNHWNGFSNDRKTLFKKSVGVFLLSFRNKLKIYFVDVGQGDCTFVVTPQNKTILIDGGGSEFGDFDVGKNTLLPYILDRGYNKIDYIFISHFDSDHVGGILTLLQDIKVEKVFHICWILCWKLYWIVCETKKQTSKKVGIRLI